MFLFGAQIIDWIQFSVNRASEFSENDIKVRRSVGKRWISIGKRLTIVPSVETEYDVARFHVSRI
jgi:hypothetical protein